MVDNIHLAYLLQAGYTHHELKEILFYREGAPSIDDLWKQTRGGIYDDSITEKRREKIRSMLGKVDERKISQYLEEKGVQIISLTHPLYPEKLKSIGHAPAFFYLRGTLREPLPPLVGVVGSRKHTPYAERILEKILPDIILSGVGIVSGGATGVDTLGHSITLENHGYTIAVFGTGIDRCYPAKNLKLFESIIASGGALISHFPLGTGPELYNFPIRNEIVAALSDGILIPEAALSSGTLITAQLALEHGRDVFAVPGDIDRSTSEGTNMLISTGQAKIVRCAGDILEEYYDLASLGAGMTPIVRVAPTFSDEKEKGIYEAIESGSNTVDSLLCTTEMGMTDILTTIAMLEIAGYVTMDEMGRYVIQ